jgi:predicted GIY-YIG superfamily endonuclease
MQEEEEQKEQKEQEEEEQKEQEEEEEEQKTKVVKAEPWAFYIVYNRGCTYAGVSPDPVRRLRKHNGELAGGAKYTLSKGPGWQHVCLVHGFQTKRQALQFEWAVKHVKPRDQGGLQARLAKLFTVLNAAHWTSKAPAAAEITLRVEWKMAETALPTFDRSLPAYVTQWNNTVTEP